MRASSAPWKTMAARGAAGVARSRGLVVWSSDHAGADEPDDAGRNDRGLARPGTRDDYSGLEGRGDGLELLLGERDAERLDKVVPPVQDRPRGRRAELVDRHDTTC